MVQQPVRSKGSFGFIPHGQFFEAPAGDDGVAFIAQGLEVDIVGGADQMADIPPFGDHEAEIGSHFCTMICVCLTSWSCSFSDFLIADIKAPEVPFPIS